MNLLLQQSGVSVSPAMCRKKQEGSPSSVKEEDGVGVMKGTGVHC